MMNHLRRRFVNIVSENFKSATCSLHRLDMSEHLFYPSTATAEEEAAKPTAAAAISSVESLPEPTFSFQPEPRLRRMEQLFALVNPRSSESRILWSSPEGVTIVYDADSNCCHAMPSLVHKGCEPVTISVPRPDADADTDTAPEEEDLYVLSSSRSSYPCFQVLPFSGRRTYKSPLRRSYKEKPRQWESLPPPPLPKDFGISSHTVLDDGVTICVTATCSTYSDDVEGGEEYEESVVTYLFDTVNREWWQADGGRWDLPFSGGAEYVPDLKLWLGLCRDEHQLCAYDLLSAASAAGEPQTLKHLGEVVEMPKEWESIKVDLLNLGDGRFCIAKIIQEEWSGEDYDWRQFCGVSTTGRMLAVLTGMEMVRGEGGGFKMVTHKSLSYIFGNDSIRWVL
jgi:hypothetical protein